jgi:hypothetical protein
MEGRLVGWSAGLSALLQTKLHKVYSSRKLAGKIISSHIAVKTANSLCIVEMNGFHFVRI